MHAQTRNSLVFAALAFALGACNVYSPDIRQGNMLEDSKLAQVKPGMTREQVRFLLGPPMIADGFHSSRWDYFYQFESQQLGGTLRRHYVVLFEGDLVTAIEEKD